VIRVEAVWLACEPLDMRAGTESALARVVKVFGEARPHHAYRLLEGRRDGAWMSPEERPAFFVKHKDLIAAAWSAIVAVEPQQRALFRVKDIQNKLAVCGIPPDHLPKPTWLEADDLPASKEPSA